MRLQRKLAYAYSQRCLCTICADSIQSSVKTKSKYHIKPSTLGHGKLSPFSNLSSICCKLSCYPHNITALLAATAQMALMSRKGLISIYSTIAILVLLVGYTFPNIQAGLPAVFCMSITFIALAFSAYHGPDPPFRSSSRLPNPPGVDATECKPKSSLTDPKDHSPDRSQSESTSPSAC